MKEELITLFNKYRQSTTSKNAVDVINAIEKYDKYIARLNLDAQRYFDMLMDLLHNEKDRK